VAARDRPHGCRTLLSERPIPERRNREVESDRHLTRAAETDARKAPEQSGQADEVWEPGAGVEAAGGHCPGLNRTGVTCRPSRSSHDAGESEWKQYHQTHVRAWGTARLQATMAKAAQAVEIIAEPRAVKAPQ